MNSEEHSGRRRLRDLVVHAISLVRRGANRRQFVVREAGKEVIERPVRVVKTDPMRKVVYGVVYAPDEIDTEGDTMSVGEIERAAYDFLKAQRTSHVDADHDGLLGRGYVAESWLVRRGDPLFAGEPEGAWAVGIKVTDEATWGRIEQGDLRAFSLAGFARAEPLVREEAGRAERRTAGRQSVMGGEDAAPRGKGYRGLSIL